METKDLKNNGMKYEKVLRDDTLAGDKPHTDKSYQIYMIPHVDPVTGGTTTFKCKVLIDCDIVDVFSIPEKELWKACTLATSYQYETSSQIERLAFLSWCPGSYDEIIEKGPHGITKVRFEPVNKQNVPKTEVAYYIKYDEKGKPIVIGAQEGDYSHTKSVRDLEMKLITVRRPLKELGVSLVSLVDKKRGHKVPLLCTLKEAEGIRVSQKGYYF